MLKGCPEKPVTEGDNFLGHNRLISYHCVHSHQRPGRIVMIFHQTYSGSPPEQGPSGSRAKNGNAFASSPGSGMG